MANLDEARRLPKFRDRAAMEREQARVLREAVREELDAGRVPKLPQHAAGDPRSLRGVPVVGVRGAGGTVRGTQPEHETIRRLMK